jgi:acetyl esterase/lipase
MYDRLPSWVARSAYLVLVLLLSLTAPVQAQEQVRYGDASVQVADLYAAGDGAPVLVLLTGGGWIRDDTALAGPWASTVQAAGVTVLVPHYTLGAPDVAEADIVQAVSFAAQLPGRGRLTLAGHSAGAHLAAMVGVCKRRNARCCWRTRPDSAAITLLQERVRRRWSDAWWSVALPRARRRCG